MKTKTLVLVSCSILFVIFLGYQYWDYNVSNTVEMKSDPYGVFTVCHPNENGTNPKFVKEGHITWSDNYCLVWDDFEGKVDYGKNKTAWTTWDYETHLDIEVINSDTRKYRFTDIDIITFFIKSQSWVDVEKLKFGDIKILRHEQGHFDLAEIHSRAIEDAVRDKLVGKIFTYENKSGDPEQLAKQDAQTRANEIFKQFPTSQSVSDTYDAITESGTNWDRQIDYNLSFDKLRNDG